MSCNQTLSNIIKPCGNGKGGLKTKIYVSLRKDVDFDGITFVEQKAPYNTINNLTSSNWYTFEFGKNASSFESVAQYDGTTNEFSFFKNSLTLSFRKMEANLRLSIMALLQSECVVIFEDANGVRYFLGYNEAVSSESATHATGTNSTDSNLVTVVLTDNSDELPYHVSDTVITAIETGINSVNTNPTSIVNGGDTTTPSTGNGNDLEG